MQRRQGFAYERGRVGLEVNIGLALKWFKAAAEGGICAAQLRLAEACERGELGLVTDVKEALKWNQKAGEGAEA